MALSALLLVATACVFDEASISMPAREVRLVPPPDASELAALRGSTRKWLTRTQRHLEPLLTERGQRVMLTEQMVDADGRPRQAYAYFEKDPATLNKLTKNWYGLVHTGQAASRSMAIERPAPPWPGFQDVWVPVAREVELAGRLGFAQDAGRVRDAPCIVVLPGLFGDNGVLRTRDLSVGLRTAGFHVLALELRSCGQTERRYPDVYCNFGVLETQDLLKVSEWLEDRYPHVRGTGLVGFCWGGNQVMLAAWFDGRRPDDPGISENLAPIVDPPSPRRHYTAGVIAFSPVLQWEELMDLTDIPRSIGSNPPAFFFQETLRDRMRRKRHPEVSGSLRRLILYEFARSQLGPSFPVSDACRFMRFLPYRGQPAGDKLECARVPVLMVTAVNDPFFSAQDLPDLIATIENPKVAGLIARGGGHVGFGPYNPAYFYSLIINFFHPQLGAAACGAGDATE